MGLQPLMHVSLRMSNPCLCCEMTIPNLGYAISMHRKYFSLLRSLFGSAKRDAVSINYTNFIIAVHIWSRMSI